MARATVLLASPATGAQIRFGQVRADGAVRWGKAVAVAAGARSAGGRLPPGQSVGLAVQVLSGRLPAQQATIDVGPRVYEVDGPLSDVVRPGPWRSLGSVDNFALFGRTAPPHPVYVVGRAGRPPPQVAVVSESANAETVRVRTASSAVLVRDVAWDAGWHASVTVDRGRTTALRVAPRGLVEQVRLPVGADLVTFTYQPPHWPVATALSVGATLLLLVLAVVTVLRRVLRRRRSRNRTGPVAARASGLAEARRSEKPPRRPPAPLRPRSHQHPRPRRGIPTWSAVGVGQREEELPLVGSPHAVDHEARGAQLFLEPLRGELGADLGQQVLTLVEVNGDPGLAQCDVAWPPWPAAASRSTARPRSRWPRGRTGPDRSPHPVVR